MTMLELLEKVSYKVKDYWVKDKKGKLHIIEKNLDDYVDNFKELMDKAVFNDENKGHTDKETASEIGIPPSMFYKFKTAGTKIQYENLEKVLNHILIRLSKEGDLADDEMKKNVGELLFCIFRRKEVKEITEHFKMPPKINVDKLVQSRVDMYYHELLIEELFGNIEQTQDISCGDYFIDGRIMEKEMNDYILIGFNLLFNEYRTVDDSKRHVVIFDVKNIDRERLHQRIRCLQRKDNVFAVLMVAKGECHDDIDFYRDEHSNIMAIEYKTVWEDNSEDCSYDYLRGMCLSWYDEKCKALMAEGIDKIIGSHK